MIAKVLVLLILSSAARSLPKTEGGDSQILGSRIDDTDEISANISAIWSEINRLSELVSVHVQDGHHHHSHDEHHHHHHQSHQHGNETQGLNDQIDELSNHTHEMEHLSGDEHFHQNHHHDHEQAGNHHHNNNHTDHHHEHEQAGNHHQNNKHTDHHHEHEQAGNHHYNNEHRDHHHHHHDVEHDGHSHEDDTHEVHGSSVHKSHSHENDDTHEVHGSSVHKSHSHENDDSNEEESKENDPSYRHHHHRHHHRHSPKSYGHHSRHDGSAYNKIRDHSDENDSYEKYYPKKDEFIPKSGGIGTQKLDHNRQPGENDLRTVGTCVMKPNTDVPESRVKGNVTILQKGYGKEAIIYYELNLQGLPAGKNKRSRTHGFHLHAKALPHDGACNSAGPHFNPSNQTHGSLISTERHLGDFGNIFADRDGRIIEYKLTDVWNIVGNIVGKSFVVHELPDDLGKGGNSESLATGNAGRRLACCTIISSFATTIRFNG